MTNPDFSIPTGLPVRLGGAMAPPGKCYFMKNPFNGDWEIVADTYETFQMAKKSGALTKAIRKLQENGALPREIIL